MIGADEGQLRQVRGNDISFIFQEPMTSLNPLHTIERQLSESLDLASGLGWRQGAGADLRAADQGWHPGSGNPAWGLSSSALRADSGSALMIAMALANEPDVLIADEPTTALDVTIQAQILELLAELKASEGMGLLFITHDLAIVRRIADRVCVMKDGEIVETGSTAEIFANPQHPIRKSC